MSTPAEKRGEPVNLADVAKVSELKDLGWNAVQDEKDKTWTAHEKEGEKRTIGPASSVNALHTQVMLAAGKASQQQPTDKESDGKTVKVGSSTLEGGEFRESSQPILPETEAAVFDDMTQAGVEYRRTTMEILRLQKLQSGQKEALEKMMEKFVDDLEVDDDDFPFFTVDIDGVPTDIVLGEETKKVLKTRVHK